MRVQIASHTEAPMQLVSSVVGPVDIWAPNIYVSRRGYDVERAKTIAGTIRSRAERYGHVFHGALLIPYGMNPPLDRKAYDITSSWKVSMGNPPGKNWELRASYQKHYAAEELKHPDTVIIPPNEYYPQGLKEADNWNYYSTMRGLITQFYKTYNLDGFVLLKTDDDLVVKRHASMVMQGMDITSPEVYAALNRGRTVEFHFSLGDMSKFIWLDLDPQPQFPFDDAKSVAFELYYAMSGQDLVRNVEVRFSGKDGFHIVGELEAEIPVDEARERSKRIAEDYIPKSQWVDKLTTDVAKDPTQMRLDYTTLHKAGGLRVPYSMAFPTGLVCLPIKLPVEHLKSFSRHEATIHNVTDMVDQMGISSSEMPVGETVDNIIKRWWMEKEALDEADARRLVGFYQYLGYVKFQEYVRQLVNEYNSTHGKRVEVPGQSQLFAAIQGQAIYHKIPLVFVASLLDEYHRKRDFSKTPEPQESKHKIIPEYEPEPGYVIQEHDAKMAGKHWDFRLSTKEGLRSWAIPKLDDLVSKKKRQVLAVETELHPYAYLSFEGTIPEGTYGAGNVSIFDTGTYHTINRDPDKWSFELVDGKMAGKYALVKTGSNRWLLTRKR